MTIRYLDKYPKNLAKSLWVLKPQWTVLKLFFKTVFHRPVTVLYPYEKVQHLYQYVCQFHANSFPQDKHG